MQLRRLGNSGLKVSAIGLGANTFGGSADAAATTAIIHRAIDLGVTFIDTADVYTRGQSEVLIGEALVGKRHQVVLATKCGLPVSDNPYERGLSRRWITHSIEVSLRKLKTDHVDLYQVHRPDEETPIEETMRALDDAVRRGRCAMSAARTTRPGSSPKRSASGGRTGSRRGSRRRTAGT